jgi:hypothetical protein
MRGAALGILCLACLTARAGGSLGGVGASAGGEGEGRRDNGQVQDSPFARLQKTLRRGRKAQFSLLPVWPLPGFGPAPTPQPAPAPATPKPAPAPTIINGTAPTPGEGEIRRHCAVFRSRFLLMHSSHVSVAAPTLAEEDSGLGGLLGPWGPTKPPRTRPPSMGPGRNHTAPPTTKNGTQSGPTPPPEYYPNDDDAIPYDDDQLQIKLNRTVGAAAEALKRQRTPPPTPLARPPNVGKTRGWVPTHVPHYASPLLVPPHACIHARTHAYTYTHTHTQG